MRLPPDASRAVDEKGKVAVRLSSSTPIIKNYYNKKKENIEMDGWEAREKGKVSMRARQGNERAEGERQGQARGGREGRGRAMRERGTWKDVLYNL